MVIIKITRISSNIVVVVLNIIPIIFPRKNAKFIKIVKFVIYSIKKANYH